MKEAELTRKHLLSSNDTEIMHKVLCAYMQRMEENLSQNIEHECHIHQQQSSIQFLLEESKENPKLSLKKVGKKPLEISSRS
jgi:hypothetical protein